MRYTTDLSFIRYCIAYLDQSQWRYSVWSLRCADWRPPRRTVITIRHRTRTLHRLPDIILRLIYHRTRRRTLYRQPAAPTTQHRQRTNNHRTSITTAACTKVSLQGHYCFVTFLWNPRRAIRRAGHSVLQRCLSNSLSISVLPLDLRDHWGSLY